MKSNNPDARIIDMMKHKRPLRSVEFFPPKDDEGIVKLSDIARSFKVLGLDFVSVTYGAGGSTREKSFAVCDMLRGEFGYVVMPHLTCVSHTKEELREILVELHAKGIRNIMSLGGDPPKGIPAEHAYKDGLRYGSDMVSLVRSTGLDFSLGVGGYPEKHPRSSDFDADMRHLKYKCDCGADFITTQLFFDNAHYYRFVESCRASGITSPIVPGIMPVLSVKQIKRFTELCGSVLPDELRRQLDSANDENPEDVEKIGVDWAHRQLQDLIKNGAPGYHLYVLNRARAALSLCKALVSSGV